MKIVKESIEFKRGGNNIAKALDVGEYRVMTPPWDPNEIYQGNYLATHTSPIKKVYAVLYLNSPRQEFKLQSTWFEKPEKAIEYAREQPRDLEIAGTYRSYQSFNDYLDKSVSSLQKLETLD